MALVAAVAAAATAIALGRSGALFGFRGSISGGGDGGRLFGSRRYRLFGRRRLGNRRRRLVVARRR